MTKQRRAASSAAEPPAGGRLRSAAGALLLATSLAASLALTSACATTAVNPPVVGSPGASGAGPSVSATQGRSAQLRSQWQLTGIDLPSDWPDLPLPKGTQVASAYAVDSAPRRTWTASFVGRSGTALDLAEPVIAALKADGYQPVSAYSASRDHDAGLFGFTGDEYSVYLVLGDVDGHPNIVMTIRQRGADATDWPTASATLPGGSNPASSHPTQPGSSAAAPLPTRAPSNPSAPTPTPSPAAS